MISADVDQKKCKKRAKLEELGHIKMTQRFQYVVKMNSEMPRETLCVVSTPGDICRVIFDYSNDQETELSARKGGSESPP